MGSLPPTQSDGTAMEVEELDEDVPIEVFSPPGVAGSTRALRYILEHDFEENMDGDFVFEVNRFPPDVVEDVSNELLICINLGLDILDLINCMFIMLGVFFLLFLMTSRG